MKREFDFPFVMQYQSYDAREGFMRSSTHGVSLVVQSLVYALKVGTDQNDSGYIRYSVHVTTRHFDNQKNGNLCCARFGAIGHWDDDHQTYFKGLFKILMFD